MDITFSPQKYIAIALTAFLPCVVCPFATFGATANVSVVNFAFSPATTDINVGDTVLWTWPVGSNLHNVTSTSAPQAWPASATLNGPATFSNTFTTAGTFPYECTVHLFTGSIIVAAAALPPSISITNPAPGAVFSEPADVTIRATASDPNSGGSVTNVQFLVGTTVLTNKTAAPFAVTASGLTASAYTFSAVAMNKSGLRATNKVSVSVVTPVPLMVSAPTPLSSTSFQFNYSANVGLRYIIQQSTDLTSPGWVTIATNTAASNPEVFTDTQATNNPGFYRVGRLPNP
jgi:plastocyanin